MIEKSLNPLCAVIFEKILDKKARFARVRAALGWSGLYHGSCIDPTNQSHTLVSPLDLPSNYSIIRVTLNNEFDTVNIVNFLLHGWPNFDK